MKRELLEQLQARLLVEGALDKLLEEAGVTREDLREGRAEIGPDGKPRRLDPQESTS